MTSYVVDASLVATAFLKEAGVEKAQAILDGAQALLVPALIFAELTNIAWKRAFRGDLSPQEAHQLIADSLSLPFKVTPSSELADHAVQLALQYGRSVYDCLYLALAVRTNSILVTADKRLVNALANTALAAHVTSLDKLP